MATVKDQEWFKFQGEYRPTSILQARMRSGVQALVTVRRDGKRLMFTPRVFTSVANYVGKTTTALKEAKKEAILIMEKHYMIEPVKPPVKRGGGADGKKEN